MLIGVSTITGWRPLRPAGPDWYRNSRAGTSIAASSFGGIDQPFGDAPERKPFLPVALLPIGEMIGAPDLYRRDLVFGAIGRPVGIFRGHDIGAGYGVVEGRVDDARLHAVADLGAQRDRAGAALQRHEIAVADAAALGVERMNLQHVLFVPDIVRRPSRLRADIVLRKNPPGGQQKREARAGSLVAGDEFGQHEAALAADEMIDMHDRRPFRR